MATFALKCTFVVVWLTAQVCLTLTLEMWLQLYWNELTKYLYISLLGWGKVGYPEPPGSTHHGPVQGPAVPRPAPGHAHIHQGIQYVYK